MHLGPEYQTQGWARREGIRTTNPPFCLTDGDIEARGPKVVAQEMAEAGLLTPRLMFFPQSILRPW